MRGFLLILMMCWLPVANGIVVGADQPAQYLPHLKDRRVSLVVNQTSIVDGKHLVDYLLDNGVTMASVMAPEHGFRGDQGAGEIIRDGIDTKTGVPILSIYGANKKPSPDMLNDIDILIFDIQDVGTRFYTYISTLHYVMEAAAENDVPLMVLDRPNPNGRFVDGPVRQPGFESFVGVDPIPVLHGMTVGELALMIKGEGWINEADRLLLEIVPVQDYERTMPWSVAVAPSPNLPNDTAIRLYPSLCFFEGTAVSVGRGTPLPFQLYGHDVVALGDTPFTPVSMASAPSPKLQGKEIMATVLTDSPIAGLDLSLLLESYQAFKANAQPFFTRPAFFDKLAGTDSLREAIMRGESEAQIRAGWQEELATFRRQRAPYLLYPPDSP